MSELEFYARFASTNPKFDFTFLYPRDWQVREIEEPSYGEVFILGPRNRDDTYSLDITVRVTSIAPDSDASLGDLVADFLTRSGQLSKFRVLSRTDGSLLAHDASDVELTYVTLLPINSVRAKETAIIERRIFLKRGNRLYELIYSAVEDDFYRYFDAFKDAVCTFEFKGEVASQRNYPLVAPLPANVPYEQMEKKTPNG
jgi:hypothetical protein